MQNQSTNLFIFLNFILTGPNGSVMYKKEDDPILPANPKRFLEFSLPKAVNKDDVKGILITTCKKNETPENVEFFKILVPQTERFFLKPSFEKGFLKVNLGNLGINSKKEFMAAHIKKIKGVFNEQKERLEKDAFKKIFEAEKNELETTFIQDKVSYNPDKSLKIYSEFENKYIKEDFEAFWVEKDVNFLFKNFIDYMFNEDRMEEDISKCVESYFREDMLSKNKDMIFKKDRTTMTVYFTAWPTVFGNNFFKILNSDHLNEIKEYLEDIASFELINDSTATSIANSFKTALEKHYDAQPGTLKIGDFSVNVKYTTMDIQNILASVKIQYLYFHSVLTEVQQIAQTIKEEAEAINNFVGADIKRFKTQLSIYQSAFENEETLTQFIEDLKTKLDKDITSSDIKTHKNQLDLFNNINSNQKVLQFILILNESKYVYPEFYAFTNDKLKLINNKVEVEIYKISFGQGIEGPQGQIGLEGPKGETGPQGKDGTAEVSGTSFVEKPPFFFSWVYQIFLLLYLISITGLLFYLILLALDQRKSK